MIIYVYDGSFEGILTCVYESYYSSKRPEKVLSKKNLQTSLVDEYIFIKTDLEKSDKVYKATIEKISQDAAEIIFNVFLSQLEEGATLIYKYLRKGFKIGCSVNLCLADEAILQVDKINNKVLGEAHMMSGLLRFVELKGEIYYAKIEPVYNIVLQLAKHFKERFANQRWIIHDVKRNVAAVYNMEEWIIIEDFQFDLPSISNQEEFFQNIWQEYFKAIAIEERINLKRQKSNMPVRYWKYLTEKKLSPSKSF